MLLPIWPKIEKIFILIFNKKKYFTSKIYYLNNYEIIRIRILNTEWRYSFPSILFPLYISLFLPIAECLVIFFTTVMSKLLGFIPFPREEISNFIYPSIFNLERGTSTSVKRVCGSGTRCSTSSSSGSSRHRRRRPRQTGRTWPTAASQTSS